jgi:hypothetical protein
VGEFHVTFIAGFVLSPFAGVPSIALADDTRVVDGLQFPLVPIQLSRRKTSKLEFKSLGTSFGARESNATKRPPVLIDDRSLSPPSA